MIKNIILKNPVYPGFFLVFFCLIASTSELNGQSVQGRIIDSRSGDALGFARVTCKSELTNGVFTDIDGKFILPRCSDSIRISYVGYFPKTVAVNHFLSNSTLSLQSKEVSTDEITITPGENPADRVIRKAISLRKENDFERLAAFSYDSYNKVIVYPKTTPIPDSVLALHPELLHQDSVIHEIDSLASKMHLFLWESITHREYLRPGKSHEIIMASRTSGLKETALPLVPADIIDFSSFYRDWVSVLGENYLGPLHSNALDHYYFQMEDTLIDGVDTLFSLSFKPKKKSFDGFAGELHIHTAKYNLQHIRADLVVTSIDKPISGGQVEQLFTKLQDSIWFPAQLITDLELGGGPIRIEGADSLKLRFSGRAYLNNIDLDPHLSKKTGSSIAVAVDRNALIRPESYWNRYRTDTLDSLDLNTYSFIDSLGKKFKFDKLLQQAQNLASGRISLGYVDLDLNRIVQYNLGEKLRLGAGFYTNDKVARWFTLGAWAGYGFGDGEWKYGGLAVLHPFSDYRFQLRYKFDHDFIESGLPVPGLIGFERFQDLIGRNIRLRYLHYEESHKLTFKLPIWKNWTTETGFRISDIEAGYLYRYNGQSHLFLNEFISEHRFTWKENYLKNGRFLATLTRPWPVLRVQWIQGVSVPDKLGLTYQLLSVSLQHNHTLPRWGKISWSIQGGQGQGDIPYPRLQVFRGNFDKAWPLQSPLSFNTMRYNEFVADRFAVFHFRYDFNDWIFHSRKYHPNPIVEYNAAWGQFRGNKSLHEIPFLLQSPDHIYQEAGIAIQHLANDFLKEISPMFGIIGLGVYYRFGAYSFHSSGQNWAFKIYSGFRF